MIEELLLWLWLFLRVSGFVQQSSGQFKASRPLLSQNARHFKLPLI